MISRSKGVMRVRGLLISQEKLREVEKAKGPVIVRRTHRLRPREGGW